MAQIEEYTWILDFNFTYDYFNASYMIISDSSRDTSNGRLAVQWILLGLYILTTAIAVPGNLIMTWHYRPKKNWRNKNIFISSLAISDLGLVIISIPFKVIGQHLYQSWPYFDLLCPFSAYLHLVLVVHRSQSLMLLTVYRHYVIFRSPQKVSLVVQGKVTYLLTLLCSFLVALPIAMYSRVQYFNVGFQTRKMCVEEWNSSKERLYYTIAIMVMQYIVPLLILCFSNFYIGFLVWARKPPGENHPQKIKEMYLAKRRTVKVLICVAVSYAISWLPLHVTTIVGSNNNQLMSQEYMQVFWMFSHWFAFTNCAVHPINYFVMDKDFRKKTKNMFGKMCCLCLKTQLQLHHRNRDSLPSHNTLRTSIKGGLVTKV
ncbi:RYamide receptor-like [Saccostrea echinata]|uniref:RYamide receptor-like n=1 Tax=Saccostrea echinata TaxID=191078 RepID=UPI002A836A58|nr:RYamide receptor-like [Saccostrea echinata]